MPIWGSTALGVHHAHLGLFVHVFLHFLGDLPIRLSGSGYHNHAALKSRPGCPSISSEVWEETLYK